MPTDWYPRSLADRIPWHANFAAQAAASGVARGLTALQATQIGLDSTAVAQLVNYSEAVDAFKEAVTAFRDAYLDGIATALVPPAPAAPATPLLALGTLPGIEARTRQYAGILKANPLYTATVGEAYGIAPSAPSGPTVPALKAAPLTQSQVSLKVAKGGYEVVAVEGKRGAGAWEFVGVAMTTTYVDARPPLVAGQPEVREYRAQGMEDNLRVGAFSEIVSAVTTP